MLGYDVAFNPLVVDAAGDLHIAYTVDLGGGVAQDYELRLATYRFGAWSLEPLDRGPYAGERTAMVMDPEGMLQLIYGSGEDRDLWHAFGSPGAWTRELLPVDPYVVVGDSVAMDAAGRIHVSHTQVTEVDHRILYTSNVTGDWITETVNDDECVSGYGSWTSIALGDVVHILFAANPSWGDPFLQHAYQVPAVVDGIDQDCDGIADE